MNSLFTTQNVSDLNFDLSRSLNLKCDDNIRLPLYGVLFIVNSNIESN